MSDDENGFDLEDFSGEINFLGENNNFNSLNGETNIKQNQEQSEFIEIWADSFRKRIIDKDENERVKILEMKDKGMKDLQEWSIQYRDSLARGRKLSRAHNQELMEAKSRVAASSRSLSNISADKQILWESICELCNFSNTIEDGNTTGVLLGARDNQKDLNRMRVLLLQLKKNPPVLLRSVNTH